MKTTDAEWNLGKKAGWSWRDVLRLHRTRASLEPPIRKVARASGMPASERGGIDGVALLFELVAALIEQPDVTLLVSSGRPPVDAALVRAAGERRAIVLLAAEPHAGVWDGGWIVPFSPPSSLPLMAVARLVGRRPGCEASPDPRALRSLDALAAHGRTLLEVYERHLPRLVRVALFEAETGAASSFPELPALDLHAELLAFVHDLRCLCGPTASLRNLPTRHFGDAAAPLLAGMLTAT